MNTSDILKQLKKRKVIFLILLSTVVFHCFSQDTIFIDPGFPKEQFQNGTMNNPYSSWQMVKFVPGITYLQKRNTTDTVDHINLKESFVCIGAYGEGDKPVVYCKTQFNKHGVSSSKNNNISIKNLEILAPDGMSCIYLSTGNQNFLIDSCILHNSEWGIRITSGGNSNHKILNSEIHSTMDDGIFIQDAINLEIGNCHIYDVNLKWESPQTPEIKAPGDGIQLSRCDNWHVHGNIIDRRRNGNKFCFISNNPNQTKGVFERNILYSPSIKGSCVFMGSGSGIIIRYNKFIGNGATFAIYHHVNNLKVYYNTFERFSKGIVSLNDSACRIINNTFYDVERGVSGVNILSINNIFDNAKKMQVPYIKVDKLVEYNNHYTRNYNGNSSTTGNPEFVQNGEEKFQLGKSSPCINKGILQEFKTDMAGNRIPCNYLPDIGAYEYCGAE